MSMCGGTSDVKDADEKVQQICDKVSKINGFCLTITGKIPES